MLRSVPVLSLTAAALLGSLGIPARAQAPNPALQVDPLPVSRAAGDLKLTFTAVERIPYPGGGDPNDPHEAAWTRLRFQYDWGGRPMREWVPQKITVTDATGQTYSPGRHSSFLGKDEGQISFAGPAWSTDRPWKIRVELARTSAVQSYEFWNVYKPEEILTVRGLRVPAPGQVVTSGQVATAQDAKVQLLGLSATGVKLPGGLPISSAEPMLHWKVERPKDTHVTFLRATDASGKVIPTKAAGMGVGKEGERYARGLDIPPGVGEIYVAFGVHKSRVFEFTAVPTH